MKPSRDELRERLHNIVKVKKDMRVDSIYFEMMATPKKQQERDSEIVADIKKLNQLGFNVFVKN